MRTLIIVTKGSGIEDIEPYLNLADFMRCNPEYEKDRHKINYCIRRGVIFKDKKLQLIKTTYKRQ